MHEHTFLGVLPKANAILICKHCRFCRCQRGIGAEDPSSGALPPWALDRPLQYFGKEIVNFLTKKYLGPALELLAIPPGHLAGPGATPGQGHLCWLSLGHPRDIAFMIFMGLRKKPA